MELIFFTFILCVLSFNYLSSLRNDHGFMVCGKHETSKYKIVKIFCCIYLVYILSHIINFIQMKINCF